MNNLEKEEKFGLYPDRDVEGFYGSIPLTMVRDKRLTATMIRIAIIISQSCGRNGWGHRSNRQIAKESCTSIRAVEDAFKQLESCDYIQREWDPERQQRFYHWNFEIGKKFDKKNKKPPTPGSGFAHAQPW